MKNTLEYTSVPSPPNTCTCIYFDQLETTRNQLGYESFSSFYLPLERWYIAYIYRLGRETPYPLWYFILFVATFMPSSLLITYPCLLRDQYKQLQHSYMFSLSSTLALKEQLKPSTTTTVLLVVFILTLYVTTCEGRHLRVHGGKDDCPSKLSPSPPKVIISLFTF